MSSNAVVGELLIATGTNTAAPSGVTMTHLEQLARVVSTAADLVAVPLLLRVGTGEQCRDLRGASVIRCPGPAKTWWYSAAATFATNTAASNGPIAYPWGVLRQVVIRARGKFRLDGRDSLRPWGIRPARCRHRGELHWTV